MLFQDSFHVSILYDEINQTLEMDISLLLQNHKITDSQNQ